MGGAGYKWEGLNAILIHQVALMDLVPSDKERGLKTPVWDEYKMIVNRAEGHEVSIGEHGYQDMQGLHDI